MFIRILFAIFIRNQQGVLLLFSPIRKFLPLPGNGALNSARDIPILSRIDQRDGRESPSGIFPMEDSLQVGR